MADSRDIITTAMIRLFNFGRRNRLSLSRIVNSRYQHCGWWLSGRVLGHYISWTWKGKGWDG